VATQRRFEANTLAEVLAKVQEEVGSDAKIASAQKVRSGGAFGFFQKERFEVLVDVPDTPAAKPAPAAVAQPMPPRPAPRSTTIIQEEDDDTLTPASLLELAQQISEEERTRTVSTESNAFADVLSRVAFQADMRSEPDPEPAVQEEQPLIPERPAFLDEPKPKAIPQKKVELETPAPAPAPQPQPPIDPQPIEPEPVPPAPEPVPEPTPAVAETVIAETVIAEPMLPTPIAQPSIAQPEPAPVAVHEEPEPEPAPVPAVRTRITDHPLAHLGLPAPYIPVDPEVVDLRATLTETLRERLPKTPVIRPSRGSIIAVVGEREEAEKLATELAREFGRPREEIILATQHVKVTTTNKVLGTVENAEDAQRSWSRRQRPTFVAIEAKPGGRDTAWAEHVLTALEPIATFGVLDATRKAEDIAAWADALGGIDCLAVNNIEETVSPASVLQAGIPVERIDGRKATPEFWALLLTERLPAA
jgi:hypothetical protein